MSQKTYGVVIRTQNGLKIMGIAGDKAPTKSDLRLCLEQEQKQEIAKVMFGTSNWKTSTALRKTVHRIENDYNNAISAVDNDKYKIKVLA